MNASRDEGLPIKSAQRRQKLKMEQPWRVFEQTRSPPAAVGVLPDTVLPGGKEADGERQKDVRDVTPRSLMSQSTFDLIDRRFK